MSLVYVGLGSNLGDRKDNLKKAIYELGFFGVVIKRSSVYLTEPQGVVGEQRDYYNMVVKFETKLSPQKLLTRFKEVEVALGRKPNTSNLPREIDLDILTYDDIVVDDQANNLVVPHPSILDRRFVLIPLSEIAPYEKHSVVKKTYLEILEGLKATTKVLKISKDI